MNYSVFLSLVLFSPPFLSLSLSHKHCYSWMSLYLANDIHLPRKNSRYCISGSSSTYSTLPVFPPPAKDRNTNVYIMHYIMRTRSRLSIISLFLLLSLVVLRTFGIPFKFGIIRWPPPISDHLAITWPNFCHARIHSCVREERVSYGIDFRANRVRLSITYDILTCDSS